jgi:hypothetical protein
LQHILKKTLSEICDGMEVRGERYGCEEV